MALCWPQLCEDRSDEQTTPPPATDQAAAAHRFFFTSCLASCKIYTSKGSAVAENVGTRPSSISQAWQSVDAMKWVSGKCCGKLTSAFDAALSAPPLIESLASSAAPAQGQQRCWATAGVLTNAAEHDGELRFHVATETSPPLTLCLVAGLIGLVVSARECVLWNGQALRLHAQHTKSCTHFHWL
jgi:hypothetical protein